MGSCVSVDGQPKGFDATVDDSSNKSSSYKSNNYDATSIDLASDNRYENRKRFILYSDFTCPYCYLEFLRLNRAMEMLPESQRIDICHGSFQLDDTLPTQGVDKYEFLSKIVPPAALDPMIEILCDQFEALGMEMNPRGLLGNSARAHRLQIWAETHLPRSQAIELKDRLFRIHSCLGKSMGDADAIVEAAADAGITDEAKIRSILDNKAYDRRLRKAKKHAKEDLGIQSVPYLLYINGKGKQRKLEEATGIETVDGFADLIATCCRR